MPYLYTGKDGVNRQLKVLGGSVRGVGRKLNNLWAYHNGANRKIFSGYDAKISVSDTRSGFDYKIQVYPTSSSSIYIYLAELEDSYTTMGVTFKLELSTPITFYPGGNYNTLAFTLKVNGDDDGVTLHLDADVYFSTSDSKFFNKSHAFYLDQTINRSYTFYYAPDTTVTADTIYIEIKCKQRGDGDNCYQDTRMWLKDLVLNGTEMKLDFTDFVDVYERND